MKKIGIALILTLIILSTCVGCNNSKVVNKLPAEGLTEYDYKLDDSKQVTLNILGSVEDFTALEELIDRFEKKHSSCTVVYTALDDYDESILWELESNPGSVNLFMGLKNDLAASPQLENYTLDLSDYSACGVNTSQLCEQTTEGAKHNGALYFVPLALDARALAVNTSLLIKNGIAVPTNYSEFTLACSALVSRGYTPIQGNYEDCLIQLLYPYLANSVVHAADYAGVLSELNNREAGSGRHLRATFEMADAFVSGRYLSYRENQSVTPEEFAVLTDTDAVAMNFLEGDVAFSPMLASQFSAIKSNASYSYSYDSNPFEYSFIPSPLAQDGSYAYIQPYLGLAINKKADNCNWAQAFMSFLCENESMKTIAAGLGCIPNTADAASDAQFGAVMSQDEAHTTNIGMFPCSFYSALRSSLLRMSQPYEYVGIKGIAVKDSERTYYVLTDGVFTEVEFDNAIMGVDLYTDSSKKIRVAYAGDNFFTPSETASYYYLEKDAYIPVENTQYLTEGTEIYIDALTEIGTIGEVSVPAVGTLYYVMGLSCYTPVADFSQLPPDTRLFVDDNKPPYRINISAIAEYYEGLIT